MCNNSSNYTAAPTIIARIESVRLGFQHYRRCFEAFNRCIDKCIQVGQTNLDALTMINSSFQKLGADFFAFLDNQATPVTDALTNYSVRLRLLNEQGEILLISRAAQVRFRDYINMVENKAIEPLLNMLIADAVLNHENAKYEN